MALAVLTLINLLNDIDRYVVPAVEESLKHSGLYTLDRQFALLASAFLLVYMCTAPLFGAYGDRPWRLKLVAVGIAVWSLATAAAGLAHNYGQLLTARAAVGIGEAAYSAIAPAIIRGLTSPSACAGACSPCSTPRSRSAPRWATSSAAWSITGSAGAPRSS